MSATRRKSPVAAHSPTATRAWHRVRPVRRQRPPNSAVSPGKRAAFCSRPDPGTGYTGRSRLIPAELAFPAALHLPRVTHHRGVALISLREARSATPGVEPGRLRARKLFPAIAHAPPQDLLKCPRRLAPLPTPHRARRVLRGELTGGAGQLVAQRQLAVDLRAGKPLRAWRKAFVLLALPANHARERGVVAWRSSAGHAGPKRRLAIEKALSVLELAFSGGVAAGASPSDA